MWHLAYNGNINIRPAGHGARLRMVGYQMLRILIDFLKNSPRGLHDSSIRILSNMKMFCASDNSEPQLLRFHECLDV